MLRIRLTAQLRKDLSMGWARGGEGPADALH